MKEKALIFLRNFLDVKRHLYMHQKPHYCCNNTWCGRTRLFMCLASNYFSTPILEVWEMAYCPCASFHFAWVLSSNTHMHLLFPFSFAYFQTISHFLHYSWVLVREVLWGFLDFCHHREVSVHLSRYVIFSLLCFLLLPFIFSFVYGAFCQISYGWMPRTVFPATT